MWFILIVFLVLPALADENCPLETLSGEEVLGKFEVPEKVDPFTFRKQKIGWTKAATQAIAARNDLTPQQKADAFEKLAEEISRRADLIVNAYKKDHPDQPILEWAAERKETQFGTVFEGKGGHVLLIDKQGRVWEIRRFTSDRIDANWNPGWNADKRPPNQDPPVLVVPPQEGAARRAA